MLKTLKSYFVVVDDTQGTGEGHLDRARTGDPLTSEHILEANLLTSLRDRVGVKEERRQGHGEGRAVRMVLIIILGEVNTLVCVPVGHWTV